MRVGLKESPYEEYKRRLDVRAVLDHYGAENVREMGDELIHSCLLDRVEPHHKNGDRNPSASANIEKKLYVCYSFWGGDIFQFIQKMEGKDDFTGIIPVLAEFLGDAVSDTTTFVAELDELFAKPGALLSIEPPSYSPRVLIPWAFSHPYLRDRGISLEASSRLQIGYDNVENRIVFPHFWKGKLVGWQKRAIPHNPGQWPGTADPEPKYRNSIGFPKADTLYAFDFATERQCVLVVESPFSVAKATSLGCDIPAVATFGAKVSDRQIDLLKDFKSVHVWMDDDAAGRSAEAKLVEGLYQHTRVSVVPPDVIPGRDLADVPTLIQLNQRLDEAVPAVLRGMSWVTRK